jgi:competence ComEA-like helix-hairpin-helix protein
MTISSHRGQITLDRNELLSVFELAIEMDAAGYYLKQQRTTALLDSPPPDIYQAYAYYAVAYATYPMIRLVMTSFGVALSWSNETGKSAYLGVFKGYEHPRPNDIPTTKEQLATYYIMVVNEDKPDPEDPANAFLTTSGQLTIDMAGVVEPAELPNLELHFAYIHRDNEVPTAPVNFIRQGTKLTVDGPNNTFQLGAYTITRPSSTQVAPPPLYKTNINTASIADLIKLPGIGADLAERIIAQRQRPYFRSVEDIQQVDGIGPAIFAQLRGYITV